MRLRYLVPSLSFLTFASGAAFAADAPAPAPSPVSIGGFVDTIGSVADTKDDGNSPLYDFQAAVELRVGYKISDKVGAKVDVEWNNNDTGSYNGHPNVYLEQAFVNYALTDEVSVTSGKFTSYAGWVSADADGLYRINAGPIVTLYGSEMVGAALNYAPTKQLGISLFVANGLGLVTPAGDRTNDNPDNYLSPAVDVVYTADGVGTFNAEFGYDYHGTALSAYSAGLNATIKPKAYEPLTIGLEGIYQKVKDDAAGDTKRYGVLGMLNHTLPNIGKLAESLTLMGQYETIDSQTTGDLYNPFLSSLAAGVTDTGKTKVDEIALALLTNPTGDAKFGVNAEISYRETEDPDSNKIKAIWFGLEMIAVIP